MGEINNFDTSARYTHQYSNFPSQVMEQTYYKDVDDSVSELVNTIKKTRAEGQYAEASNMISRNISKLKNMFISAVDINRLVEEIRNAQIFAIKKRKLVYIDAAEPEAEFEGDVWFDIDNTVEDPEKNTDLVEERNKTPEDYEAEIDELRSTYEALEGERLDFEAKNLEIERLSQEYEALRRLTESSATELQQDYTNLVNEDAARNESLAQTLEYNGVDVRKQDGSLENNWNVLIEDVNDVRSGGTLCDIGSTIKTKYVPKGETWYAQRRLYTGTAEIYDTVNLTPTTKEQGKFVGGAGYYEGIKVDCDGVYNQGYQDGYAQGKDVGQLKQVKLGSVFAGASNSGLDGEHYFELPYELRNQGITIDNIFIVPTSIVLNANSTYNYDNLDPDIPQPTPTNPYNVSIDGIPFAKSMTDNVVKITVNKLSIDGQYDEAIARAWVNADVYVMYMKR